MEENSEIQWDKEIKLLLFSNKIANRTALESMLSFGSQQISVQSRSSVSKIIKELEDNKYDIIILCIFDIKDKELIVFLNDHPQVPVILIDNYYNRSRAETLLVAGALDYLDISTLDSRLLIKTINYSIQRKDAENLALQAQNRMKIRSTFLANMSHEIRTPLNSIIGFSELLFDEETDAVKREKLNMIRQSGKHLLTLINGILDFSKLEAGKVKADNEDFSIDDLVMTLYYMMLVKSGDRNLDLNIKPLGKIPELVHGDEFRINQVLINLMNNAIKFTEKGSVTLEYNYDKDKAIFSVIDTGIGIPRHQQEHIFDAFEQVYEPDFSQQPGTGLGLAISRNLVHLMNGTIKVISEPGTGSTFTVTIPLPVIKWQTDKNISEIRNKFPARKLGIIFLSREQKETVYNWFENKQIDTVWSDPESWQNDNFLGTDVILIPQGIPKSVKSKLFDQLLADFQTCYKPRIFYFSKNEKLFFVVNKKLFYSSYIEVNDKLLDQNLKPDDFIIFLNNFFEKIETKGKEMIRTWKKNFVQENPGLEEVLYEAIMRMQEKIRQLNQAAAGNNYKEIEEIAHSLKGFTGQTCIYEISNRASIILDEIRSNKDDPHLDVIRRELASLNEIIYLLPRKFIGITPRLRPALEKPIHPEFPPMKILVAEDNPINQAVIKDFLRHFNLSCTLVDNGLSALKELQSDAFDILFLDIQMPVMNGIETLKRIRMDSHLGDVFVVVLTAYVFEVSNDKFLQNNCDAFLIKPFEKKHLLEILQKAAENYKKKSTEKII